ncbi:hypothetical protein TTHERM_01075760 (macronuclear) [Tetrahymena thermophila SB210]|uniref:PH domain-containing protein n=1 Tax=Tetrahymena thermophila (strain SB210) TaxID=312017 RepID=Q22C64_TETTS|nr:hypothetical protein TTHERM_01075760 [Tetrahymena thermophila SB210]EAR82892.2 hypothetical protein TTHERM_01075760 [Tetrahymena thermophila SB210]|eukprot:XP_001030555.2 hypothetical protein TTHERM_01075760 [Tetrahymena thermophila SB210]
MDNLDSANTSTYALLSNVNSQSVFEKFKREDEAIQKYYESESLKKISYLDPNQYYQQLYNQIEQTENIIKYLNYVLIEQPQLAVQEKIQSVKQNMQRSGKNIPSHLDIYIREKLERDKKIDIRNNIHGYKRTYLQSRYLKNKKDAKTNEQRVQKVEQFLQEQEQLSYFLSKKSIYDDNIKIPFNLMQNSSKRSQIFKFEEQEILFTVKSVKIQPYQMVEDYELYQYQDYLIEHLKEPYQICVYPPEEAQSSTKSIKLSINLNQLNSQNQIGNKQDDIEQKIEILTSRLEQSQVTCDMLIDQYLMKINDTSILSNQTNILTYDNQNILKDQELNQDISDKISILKKKRAKQEIKIKGKLGWIKDENQILYAYNIKDKEMEEYNFNVFEKLLKQYSQVECEIQFYESEQKQKLKILQQNNQTRKKVSEFLKKKKNILYIFYHIILQASLDNIQYLFPFAENIYPLYNCNYETDVQQKLLSNNFLIQKQLINIPLYLQKMSSLKELNKGQEQIPKLFQNSEIIIAVLRVFKKHNKMNQYKQNKIIVPQLKIEKNLNQINQINNLQFQNSTPKIYQSNLKNNQLIIQQNEQKFLNSQNKIELEEIMFENLQKQFCDIYSAQSSSRSKAGSQQSIKSEQQLQQQHPIQKEKNKEKEQQNNIQFLPINFKYKSLSQQNQLQKKISQTQMINTIQNDYLIQQLIDTTLIANIPISNSKQKTKDKPQIIEQVQEDSRNLYDEDIIKAASVFKKSKNKDKFKFRWLELKQFTLIWYKSAPELKFNQSNGKESIVQKKPNGFGEIQIDQVEDFIVAKKHAFIVKLLNRNLVIEYDSTRVGLMWSKTIRNMVALKAYMHYLIKIGNNGNLFKYFNDLDVIELNLSHYAISNKELSKKNLAIEQKLCILIFDTITSHQKLQIINLQNSGLSPISIKELFKYLSKPLKKTRINFINLSQNEMDPESVRQLNVYLQSENCQQLQNLVLDDCNLKDGLFSLILDAIKERYKWQMHNYYNPVKDEIPEETTWRQVSLRYSNKSNQNSPRKEQVYFFQRLSFAGNQITDKGLQRFMKTIEDIQNQAQPLIQDLEDFEMIDLDLSRNQFINELSNFGAFISQRQIFKKLYLDNLKNPLPNQLASFILSFQDNYRTELLSLRGNPLSVEAYTNLIKVLDENFTIQEIKIDFTTFNQFEKTYTELDKQSNNLRSQFFSFSLIQSQQN